MPKTAKAKSSSKDSTGKLGFEAKLLLAADKLATTWTLRNTPGGGQRVPAECLNSFRLAVPPRVIADRIDALTIPLIGRIKANADKSRTLANLHYRVQQEPLNGELPV